MALSPAYPTLPSHPFCYPFILHFYIFYLTFSQFFHLFSIFWNRPLRPVVVPSCSFSHLRPTSAMIHFWSKMIGPVKCSSWTNENRILIRYGQLYFRNNQDCIWFGRRWCHLLFRYFNQKWLFICGRKLTYISFF